MFDPSHAEICYAAECLAQDRLLTKTDWLRLGNPPSEQTYLRIAQALWDIRDAQRQLESHRADQRHRRAQGEWAAYNEARRQALEGEFGWVDRLPPNERPSQRTDAPLELDEAG